MSPGRLIRKKMFGRTFLQAACGDVVLQLLIGIIHASVVQGLWTVLHTNQIDLNVLAILRTRHCLIVVLCVEAPHRQIYVGPRPEPPLPRHRSEENHARRAILVAKEPRHAPGDCPRLLPALLLRTTGTDLSPPHRGRYVERGSAIDMEQH